MTANLDIGRLEGSLFRGLTLGDVTLSHDEHPSAIEIQAIELIDGTATLRDPFQFGAAHVPTEFRSLNASMSLLDAFAIEPSGELEPGPR